MLCRQMLSQRRQPECGPGLSEETRHVPASRPPRPRSDPRGRPGRHRPPDRRGGRADRRPVRRPPAAAAGPGRRAGGAARGSARRRCRPARPWSAWSLPAAPSPWCRRPPRAGWTSACGWTTSSPAAACSPARDLGAATVRIPLTRARGRRRRGPRLAAARLRARTPPRRRRGGPPGARRRSRAAHRGDRGLRPARPDLRGRNPAGRRITTFTSRWPGRARTGAARRAGEDRPALVVPGRPGLATEPVPGDAPSARWEVTGHRAPRPRTASTSAGRSSAATAPTGTWAWPGATCPATERCGCSAAPSSGSSTSIPAWSRRPCAPGTGSSPGSG